MPLGKAISNTYGYVIDSKFRLLPLYTEGEYVIGGDSVALYYINKPELTKEKFVQDEITNKGRMYKTGDIVRMLDEGHIDFIGRRDNQVKIRGYRIELDEIKLAIQKHNLIKDVSVFIYEDDFNQKKIAAFYTVNSHLSEEELKTYLKDNLISYMVPSYICNLEKLPLNQNGKVNVKELKQIIKSDTKKETRDITEYYGLEKQIYTIFKSVLNREDILPEDSFFEIGGDSVAAIKVISEAMKHDITITFADLYKYPSISELADMLENKLDKGSISKGIEAYDYTNIEELLGLNKITDAEIMIKPLGGVLLTGATGFLGAHILEYLLNNTESTIYCLVRKSGTYNTVEEKLLNKMNFFFGSKYDNYFNDRIKVVEGDILLDSITINEDSKQQIIDNVSTIINSAAYVKHYGNEKLFKKINTKGVEYLAKFALEYNKKLVHISTLSVSGNILEVGQIEQTNIKKGTIYNENNLYIGQNLDNIYAYTKFLGERVVYEYIGKGLNAQIMRMGNLTSRTYDGKFQPNVEENAFANRLKTIINLNVLPENLLEFNVEFTPIDKAAEAICLLAQTKEFNTYHIFNHNHIVMEDLDKIFKKLGINLRHISKQEMTELIDFYTNQEKGYEMVKGVIQDLNKNKELDYTPNTKIKSDFTIDVLAKLNFYWPLVNEEYITKYITYLDKINFFKGENK